MEYEKRLKKGEEIDSHNIHQKRKSFDCTYFAIHKDSIGGYLYTRKCYMRLEQNESNKNIGYRFNTENGFNRIRFEDLVFEENQDSLSAIIAENTELINHGVTTNLAAILSNGEIMGNFLDAYAKSITSSGQNSLNLKELERELSSPYLTKLFK